MLTVQDAARGWVELETHFDRLAPRVEGPTALWPDKIEHEITVQRRKLEQSVRNGYEELRQLHARVINARTQLHGPVEAAYAKYLQADENYKAVSR
jgi:hypothetical protein